MLPFRVENCYEMLVKVMREGKLLDTPGQLPRDEHATKWAGFLSHYLADNTQAWRLEPDGTYKRLKPGKRPARCAQLRLLQRLAD